MGWPGSRPPLSTGTPPGDDFGPVSQSNLSHMVIVVGEKGEEVSV